MSEEGLDREEIHPVLVKMGAEGMAEGMTGDAVIMAKLILSLRDVAADKEGIDRAVLPALFREEITGRSAAGKPVVGKDSEGGIRKDGIPVGAVLSVRDVDAHVFAGNVLIP